MTIQLKLLSPSKALFQEYTNHNFKHFSWTYSTQQQVSCECVCVCSPTLFLLMCKRYYEETGSNLSTKTTEKSSFSISYKRDENYLVILAFFFLYIRGVGQSLVKRLPSIHHCIWTCVGCKVTIHILRKAFICFISFG